MKSIIKFFDKQLALDYLPEKAWEQYYVFRQVEQGIYYTHGLENSPASIQEYFAKCTEKWIFEKFYFKYEDGCFVEPVSGWALTKSNMIIPQSVWNSYMHGLKPSYLRLKLSNRNIMHVDSAIVLSYAWNNYFHFHNDIIGQLRMADDAGVNKDTPIIVNANLQNMSYFKQIVQSAPELRDRNWLFQQPNTKIECSTAHFFNTYMAHRRNFDAVLDYTQFDNVYNDYLNRRIFVSRNPKRGRVILNFAAIKIVLDKYGFEVVECDDMTVQQQAELFRNASHTIGIHGAGLTNIIYRRGRPMTMLDIFSKDYFNPVYFWLCQQYGYDYHSMVAGESDNPTDQNGNFMIDEIEFEKKILAMLG